MNYYINHRKGCLEAMIQGMFITKNTKVKLFQTYLQKGLGEFSRFLPQNYGGGGNSNFPALAIVLPVFERRRV